MEILDPRQQKFLQHYLDPKSPTFSNALQSALKAGYAQEYAESITYQMPDWLSENLGDASLVTKAIANLDGLLDEEDKKIKADMTKFVLERLHKGKYSTRTELTGSDGKDLPTPILANVQVNKDDVKNV